MTSPITTERIPAHWTDAEGERVAPMTPPNAAVSAPSPSSLGALVHAVLTAHAKHEEAVRNRPSFSAAPSPHQSQTVAEGSEGDTRGESEGTPLVPSGHASSTRSGGGGEPKSCTSVVVSEPATESYTCLDPTVELGKAANQLYLALGGTDYRRIAQSTVETLEHTIDMIREGYALLKSMHLVPAAELTRYAERFQTLLSETKEMMDKGSSGVSPVTPAASPVWNLSVRSGQTPTAAPGAGGSGGPRGTRAPAAVVLPEPPVPAVIADDEMYDIGLMLPSTSGSQEKEGDDEVLFLKARVKALSAEKAALQSSVEKLEGQLKRQMEITQRDATNLRDQSSEMEKDLRWVLDQVDRGVWLPSYNSPAPTHRTGESVPAQGEGGSAERSGTTSPTTAIESPMKHPQLPHVDANDIPSVRVNKMDALYADTYRGRGMELIWNAIECVFKREYATAVVSTTSPTQTEVVKAPAQPRSATTPFPLASGARSSLVSVSSSSNLTYHPHQAAYESFKRSYHKRIATVLDSRSSFLNKVIETTPLRSDYVANCLGSRLKPNSGVVKLLTRLGNDESLDELCLNSFYVGDAGLSAVVPLLSRLYRLKELDVADNGIKNAGVHLLCQTLSRHPSIRTLNVNGNPISRSAGKDLLALASSCPNVTSIQLERTQLEPVLVERIQHRLALNQEAWDAKHPPESEEYAAAGGVGPS